MTPHLQGLLDLKLLAGPCPNSLARYQLGHVQGQESGNSNFRILGYVRQYYITILYYITIFGYVRLYYTVLYDNIIWHPVMMSQQLRLFSEFRDRFCLGSTFGFAAAVVPLRRTRIPANSRILHVRHARSDMFPRGHHRSYV